MSKIWDRVYSNDSAFFGEEPSDFAQKCYSDFKRYNVKRLLELGCGQGRDTIFFASNGLDVHAVDSSKVAIENINQKMRGKNICLHLSHFEVRQTLPFDSTHFDAVYSHMFYNMSFTDKELKFLFKESRRVLKNNGLLYFSVRSDKDILYNKGKKIDSNIYEINAFQIRFFNIPQIKSFLRNYFEIKNIIEADEEPVSLYLVFCCKKE